MSGALMSAETTAIRKIVDHRPHSGVVNGPRSRASRAGGLAPQADVPTAHTGMSASCCYLGVGAGA
jgi:hypothetical protein